MLLKFSKWTPVLIVQKGNPFKKMWVIGFIKCSRELTAAFVIIATFANVGNLGLLVIEFKLGHIGEVPATIYFMTLLLYLA